MRRNRRSRFIGMAAIGALTLLVLASAWTFYQGRDSLNRLIHPIGTHPPTPVYGRWLDVAPGAPLSINFLIEWLNRLDYRPVAKSPQNPQEYWRSSGDTLAISLRGFTYPDQNYPAKHIVIEFKNGTIKSLEEAAGSALERWRIEPIVIANWGTEDEERRPRIRMVDLPPYVPGAILAVEDKRFYNHWGIDAIGLARALWHDLRHRSFRQGGSTVTQQLARSVFLDTQRTLRRKVLEAALTLYLEIRFTKPQLLEMYLNQVYWGQDGAESLFGLESASQRYFGQPARALTLAQAATLAGMLQSPNRLSPRTAPEASRTRRNRVLRLMREQGRILPAQERIAQNTPIQTAPSTSGGRENAYFLAWIRAELESRYTAEALSRQGWRIFTTLDPLWQRIAQKALAPKPKQAAQAALVAIEPGTGAIRSWIGGTDFIRAPFDRVLNAHRQPGSAFKPFVVLAALLNPNITLATLLDDSPITLTSDTGRWTPKNYDRRFRGRVSVRQALVESLNVPIVRLAKRIGLPIILETARRAGIENSLRSDLATALGASETTLLELTNAYATLAAGGVQATPFGIVAILTREGARLDEPTANTRTQAIDSGAAFLVTEALTEVFDKGTAVSARQIGFLWPAAGKTGTSENFQDAWFLGYSPDLAIGVWMGEDQPKSLGHSAAALALPIWVRYANAVWRGRAPWTWSKPEGIEEKTIDPQSGLLVRSGCPTRRQEYFLQGTSPTQNCALHAGGLSGWFKRLTTSYQVGGKKKS